MKYIFKINLIYVGMTDTNDYNFKK